jgi:hypothetical protein
VVQLFKSSRPGGTRRVRALSSALAALAVVAGLLTDASSATAGTEDSRSITTHLSADEILAGDSVHDSATLHDESSDVGGSVEYRFYSSLSDCQADTEAFPDHQPMGGTSAGTVTVTNGVVPDSDTVAFEDVGTFFWAAFFTAEDAQTADDGHNHSEASDCATEKLKVKPAKPEITTQLSDDSIPAGGSVHDSATLTDATSHAGGMVEYRFYSSLSDCQSDTEAFPGDQPSGGTPAGTVTVTNGVVPDSDTVTFPNTGTFFWAAFYSGDDNNKPAVSDCATEELTVKPAQPEIATQLSASSIPAGGSVHDSATLTGATSDAGGSVEYRFYSSLSACQTDTEAFPGMQPSGGTSAGTVTVTDASVPNSDTVTFPSVGTFFWAAFYSGDDHNKPAVSDCTTEQLTVHPTTPAIATSLSASSIPLGGSVHDTATLTGATPTAGGSVQYRFYPSLTACQTDTSAFPGTQPTGGTPAGTVTVTNAVVPNSDTVTFPNAGAFFWAAFYSGDTNNGAADSACVNEQLTVRRATTTITSLLSASSIVAGGSVHDSATLAGATANAGGTVEFRFYPSLSSCQTDTSAFPETQPTGGTSAGTVTVTNGVVPISDTVTFPSVGTFFWAAFYSGDDNNAPADSACANEELTVVAASPTPTPTPTASLAAAALPVTGIPAALFAGFAGSLVAAGFVVLMLVRRRRA